MPQRSALLVATYRYQDTGLRQLLAPGHDAEALAEVLRDPEIANFDVTILINEPHHVVGNAIGKFYRNRRRDDLTLLYFTGHGLKDDQGHLYLAMADTNRDDLLFTALSAQQIDSAMESCASRQKVLILDCCYSGAFPAGRVSKAGGQVHTLEKFQGKGRVVLTASDATQYSFEGNDIVGEGMRSVFTRVLVEGLTSGEADLDDDGDISIDELYTYVHDRVIEEMPQQRPKKLENIEGRIVLAQNIHWSLPDSIRNAIESPFTRDRLAAVKHLAHLHRIGNDLVRTEVINHARCLIDDDSKAVSAEAMKLFPALNPAMAGQEPGKQVRQKANAQSQRETNEQVQLPEQRQSARPLINDHSKVVSAEAMKLFPALNPAMAGQEPGKQAWQKANAQSQRETNEQAQLQEQSQPEKQDHDQDIKQQWAPAVLSSPHERENKRQVVTSRARSLPIISTTTKSDRLKQRPGVDEYTQNGAEHTRNSAETRKLIRERDVGSQARHHTDRWKVPAWLSNWWIPSSAPPMPSDTTVRPPPGEVTSRLRGRPVQIVIGSLLALTMTTILVISVAINRSSSGLAPTPEPTPSTATTAGPEVAIPALGATIPVGKTPGFIAVSPNGRHAYIANRDTQLITVLDTAVNKVTATISIPTGPPQFLTFTPDGRTLYVTIYNDQQTIHAIDVIDTASNTVSTTIPQPARPFLPAVTPDGKRLFVPNHDIASVSVIDTASNTVIAQIPVAPNPHWVAFSPDGSRAYTANHESNLVSMINTATLKVVATIPVGISPHSIAVHPNRPLVANVNYDANTVSVIDANTLKVIATIPVEKNPRDIVWAPDGRFAYVVNEDSNSVSVIDARTDQVTATIPTGGSPSSIAVPPNGRQAYVTNLDSGTITVLELTG